MKVNFKIPFADCFGNTVMRKTWEGGKEADEPVMVWHELAVQLFNASTSGQAPLDAAQKYMAYTLSRRIAASPDAVDLTPEEAALLKMLSSTSFSAGAYGQIADILDCKIITI